MPPHLLNLAQHWPDGVVLLDEHVDGRLALPLNSLVELGQVVDLRACKENVGEAKVWWELRPCRKLRGLCVCDPDTTASLHIPADPALPFSAHAPP